MLPLLVRLDALVVVLSPSDGLVEHLLDAESIHFVLVFEDVVHD